MLLREKVNPLTTETLYTKILDRYPALTRGQREHVRWIIADHVAAISNAVSCLATLIVEVPDVLAEAEEDGLQPAPCRVARSARSRRSRSRARRPRPNAHRAAQ